MVAALRAAATAGGGQSAGVNSLSITVPTSGVGGSVIANDIALICLLTSATAVTLTNPTGWTPVYTADNDGSTTLSWLILKTLASGDIGNAVALGLSGFARADADMIVVSGATVSGILNAHTLITTASTGSPTPTIASVPAGAFIAEFFAGRANAATAATLTFPTGITDAGATVKTGYSAAPNNSISAGYEIASSLGAYGGDTGTWSSNCNGAAYTVALPAVATNLNDLKLGTGTVDLDYGVNHCTSAFLGTGQVWP